MLAKAPFDDNQFHDKNERHACDTGLKRSPYGTNDHIAFTLRIHANIVGMIIGKPPEAPIETRIIHQTLHPVHADSMPHQGIRPNH